MNFKPTLWKSIVSVVISVMAFIIGYWIKTHLVLAMGAEELYPSLKLLLPVLPRLDIYLSIIFLILVYIVWSLFQRREDEF